MRTCHYDYHVGGMRHAFGRNVLPPTLRHRIFIPKQKMAGRSRGWLRKGTPLTQFRSKSCLFILNYNTTLSVM
jgi:hypothetical protein